MAVTVSWTDFQARPAPLVLLGCLLCSMVTASPIIATTVSVFIVPISKEFGWARTQFPLIILVSAVIAGVVVTPLAGRVLDRLGTKPVMIAGAVVFAIANVLAAFNDGVVWHAFLIYLLIGSSASFTGMFGVNKIVSVWFSKTRGRALGVTVGLGVGLGAAMTPLLTQYFVQHSGWRSAYFALAALILVFTIPSVLLLTPNTKGAKADLAKAGGPDEARLSTRQILKMRDFRLLIVLAAANGLAAGGLMGHWIPIQTGRGMSITLATLLLSSFGLLKAFAQVGGGLLLDKISDTESGIDLLRADYAGYPPHRGRARPKRRGRWCGTIRPWGRRRERLAALFGQSVFRRRPYRRNFWLCRCGPDCQQLHRPRGVGKDFRRYWQLRCWSLGKHGVYCDRAACRCVPWRLPIQTNCRTGADGRRTRRARGSILKPAPSEVA